MSQEFPEYLYPEDEWADEIADFETDLSITLTYKEAQEIAQRQIRNITQVWVDGELIWHKGDDRFPFERTMEAPIKFINARPGNRLERGGDSFTVLKIVLDAKHNLTLTLGSNSESLFHVESLEDFKLVGN